MKAKSVDFMDSQAALDQEKAVNNQPKKANDATDIEFSKPQSIVQVDMEERWYSKDLKRKNQVAIIGFWRQDLDKEFYCYHYFYVPNPCVREFTRSERKCYINTTEMTTISCCEILFKGDDDLFLIFNPS